MIWFLLVLFQIKHWICDFPLQGQYMLGKFKPGYAWILPLLAHASVHAVTTFLIAYFIKPDLAIWLALFDLVTHFVIDRIKASPNLLGKFKSLDATCYVGVAEMAQGKMPVPLDKEDTKLKQEWAVERLKSNTYFWWALGADQTAHHLTHYFIIWSLLQ